jgi:flagellar biosynthesis protein FliQ
MYNQKYLWPLPTMLDMPKNCAHCGQKTELESGFFFGTGYVSYALSVAFLIGYFVAFHLIIGLSIEKETVIPCLISAICVLILIQPWMMRLSRILYLNLFVKYDAKATGG